MHRPETGPYGPLICPYCGTLLARDTGAYRCENGHAFDVAREGQVYLRRTRNSGDSLQRLRARSAFLDRGHYAPLAALVCRTVEAACWDTPNEGGSTTDILDSGCGVGYYLQRLQAHLAGTLPGKRFRYWGLDSSRDAARMAARRCRDATVVIGDCKDSLPFATGSLHVIVDIFAPRNAAEFSRVLAPGGLLLVVMPDRDHLAELRDRYCLLGIEEHKERHVLAGLDGSFSAFDVQKLALALDLSADDVSLLVTMLPARPHDGMRRVAPLREEQHRVTASFRIVACRRTADNA